MKPKKSSLISDIWSPSIAKQKYVRVPMAILNFYPALGITPAEYLLLTCIISHKWYSDSKMFPSLMEIAHKLGRSESVVYDNAISLVDKGLLAVIKKTGRPSTFSIDPLVLRLDALISATKKPDYFQVGSRSKTGTLPHLKTGNELDELKLNEEKEAKGETQQAIGERQQAIGNRQKAPIPFAGEGRLSYDARLKEFYANNPKP